jgi:peptide-methionine (R)-S-oxide reductase
MLLPKKVASMKSKTVVQAFMMEMQVMKETIFTLILMITLFGCQAQEADTTKQTIQEPPVAGKYNPLTPWQQRVILEKATDRPFTGDYYNKREKGIYVCRQCNNRLYQSDDKFESHCGWPSFDDEIDGSVIRVPDADGMRTEIVCANCKGHLGHVFIGEGFTDKDIRHCVNTSSILFYPSKEVKNIPEVIH